MRWSVNKDRIGFQAGSGLQLCLEPHDGAGDTNRLRNEALAFLAPIVQAKASASLVASPDRQRWEEHLKERRSTQKEVVQLDQERRRLAQQQLQAQDAAARQSLDEQMDAVNHRYAIARNRLASLHEAGSFIERSVCSFVA